MDANNQKPQVRQKLLRLDSFILEGRRRLRYLRALASRADDQVPAFVVSRR